MREVPSCQPVLIPILTNTFICICFGLFRIARWGLQSQQASLLFAFRTIVQYGILYISRIQLNPVRSREGVHKHLNLTSSCCPWPSSYCWLWRQSTLSSTCFLPSAWSSQRVSAAGPATLAQTVPGLDDGESSEGCLLLPGLSLSYPADALACDVSLLFLLAIVGYVHYFCGKSTVTWNKTGITLHLNGAEDAKYDPVVGWKHI